MDEVQSAQLIGRDREPNDAESGMAVDFVNGFARVMRWDGKAASRAQVAALAT